MGDLGVVFELVGLVEEVQEEACEGAFPLGGLEEEALEGDDPEEVVLEEGVREEEVFEGEGPEGEGPDEGVQEEEVPEGEVLEVAYVVEAFQLEGQDEEEEVLAELEVAREEAFVEAAP